MTLNLDRSAWQKVKFGDVVRNVNDNVKDPASGGINRVLGLEHLDPGELRIQRWGDVSPELTFTRRVRPGQTLFGKRRAYQRKTAYAEFDAVCSGDILVFESADPTRLLPELLPFIAMTDAFYAMALETSAGSLSPRTRWSDIAKYEFDLPPLSQQRRFTELLWSAVAHRSSIANRQVADQVASRALMDSLFRSLRCEWRPFGEVGTATVGVVVKPAQYYVSEGGVPAIRATNVFPGRFDLDELVYFDAQAESSMFKTRIKEGDVIIVRTGRTGEAAAATEQVIGMNTIGVILARPGEIVLPKYLEGFLNSERGRAQVARRTAGSAQPNLNVGELLTIEVPIASQADQQMIVGTRAELDESAARLRDEAMALRELQSTLLEAIFGGRHVQ